MERSPQLGVHLAQRQTLAPRLSESLRILSLPTFELSESIAEAISENPLLEVQATEPVSTAGEQSSSDRAGDEIISRLEWSSTPASPPFSDDPPEQPEIKDLRTTLLEQLDFVDLKPTELTIALAIVDALDPDGYLRLPLEELANDNALPSYDPTRYEAVLTTLQQFEPAGVAARNLQECLLIQLQELPDERKYLSTARKLIADYCDQLARIDVDRLASLLNVQLEEVQGALRLIRTLDPRPGLRYDITPTEYLIPEIIALPVGRQWRIEINPQAIPRVFLNQDYARWLAANRRRPEASALASQCQEAKWLIRSLEQRQETLLRIGNYLVSHQSNFLRFGDMSLRPLTQAQLANELEIHESTVSRAVNGKSMGTPRGVIPLRRFFSSPLASGPVVLSAVAVKAQLKKLIDSENRSAPLSDDALAKRLDDLGIRIARRTVAKYREALGIPGARSRKHIA